MMSAGTSSLESTTKIDEKTLLDWGAKIGVAAKRENVSTSQLENLIATLSSIRGREALLVAAVYAMRQAQRRGEKEEGGIGPVTARLVSQALTELYRQGAGIEEARKVLDFSRWVYEAFGEKFPKMRAEQYTLEKVLGELVG